MLSNVKSTLQASLRTKRGRIESTYYISRLITVNKIGDLPSKSCHRRNILLKKLFIMCAYLKIFGPLLLRAKVWNENVTIYNSINLKSN